MSPNSAIRLGGAEDKGMPLHHFVILPETTWKGLEHFGNCSSSFAAAPISSVLLHDVMI